MSCFCTDAKCNKCELFRPVTTSLFSSKKSFLRKAYDVSQCLIHTIRPDNVKKKKKKKKRPLCKQRSILMWCIMFLFLNCRVLHKIVMRCPDDLETCCTVLEVVVLVLWISYKTECRFFIPKYDTFLNFNKLKSNYGV